MSGPLQPDKKKTGPFGPAPYHSNLYAAFFAALCSRCHFGECIVFQAVNAAQRAISDRCFFVAVLLVVVFILFSFRGIGSLSHAYFESVTILYPLSKHVNVNDLVYQYKPRFFKNSGGKSS